MFGNNYYDSFQQSCALLEEAYHFWATSIITMDPFERKITISTYEQVVSLFRTQINESKMELDERFGLPVELPKEYKKKENVCTVYETVLK